MSIIDRLRDKLKRSEKPDNKEAQRKGHYKPVDEEALGRSVDRVRDDHQIVLLLEELPEQRRNFTELGKLLATKGLSGANHLWAAIARRGKQELCDARDGCFGRSDGNRFDASAYGGQVSATHAEQRRDHVDAPAAAPSKMYVDKATPGVRPGEGEYTRSGGTWQHQGAATAATPHPDELGTRGHVPGKPDAADEYVHEDKVATFSTRAAMDRGVDRTAYLGQTERAPYAASVGSKPTGEVDANGKPKEEVILVDAKGAPLETKDGRTNLQFAAQGRFIFTLSKTGKLYLANAVKEATDRTAQHRDGGGRDQILFHHTSLLAGADVLAAGDIEIHDGKIVALSNDSGHYKMGIESNVQVLEALDKLGFDTRGLRVDTKTPNGMVKATGDAVLNSAGNTKLLENHAHTMSLIGTPGAAYGKGGELLTKQRASIAEAEASSEDLGKQGQHLLDEITDRLSDGKRLGVDGQLCRGVEGYLRELGDRLKYYRDTNKSSDAAEALALTICSARRAYDSLRQVVEKEIAQQRLMGGQYNDVISP